MRGYVALVGVLLVAITTAMFVWGPPYTALAFTWGAACAAVVMAGCRRSEK